MLEKTNTVKSKRAHRTLDKLVDKWANEAAKKYRHIRFVPQKKVKKIIADELVKARLLPPTKKKDNLVAELISRTEKIYRNKWPEFELVSGRDEKTKSEMVACENGVPQSIDVRLTISLRFLPKNRKPMEVVDFGLRFPKFVDGVFIKKKRKG